MAARTPKPLAASAAAAKKADRQTVLRLPEDLAVRLDALAEQTGASKNSLIVEALRLVLDQPHARLVISTRAEDQRTARHKHKH